jgi:tetratricopeptide (TPR) repeat protein
MSLIRLPISTLAFLACFAGLAMAQVGGVDGGGGGGIMVPSQDEDGDTLMRTFRDGVALLAEGKCKEAEEKFEKILKQVPRNSQTNYLRGVALQCMHRYKASLRYFQRAKRDDAEFWQAYGGLGISYLAIDRVDRARKELDELTKYKRLCEKPNRRCPPELLKAYEKLATAFERAEGGVDDSVEGPQR